MRSCSKITEPSPQYGRLIVADYLPAGFEIDNPNLVSSGETSALDWIEDGVEPVHSEFRDDHFGAAFDRTSRDPAVFTVAYVVRAVSPGKYVLPQAYVEDMYRPDRYGRTGNRQRRSDVGEMTTRHCEEGALRRHVAIDMASRASIPPLAGRGRRELRSDTSPTSTPLPSLLKGAQSARRVECGLPHLLRSCSLGTATWWVIHLGPPPLGDGVDVLDDCRRSRRPAAASVRDAPTAAGGCRRRSRTSTAAISICSSRMRTSAFAIITASIHSRCCARRGSS